MLNSTLLASGQRKAIIRSGSVAKELLSAYCPVRGHPRPLANVSGLRPSANACSVVKGDLDAVSALTQACLMMMVPQEHEQRADVVSGRYI